MKNLVIKRDVRPIYGCDPEIFLEDNHGAIVGSERVLPEEGLSTKYTHTMHDEGGQVKLIRDGVQVELNLPPTKCRSWLATEIGYAFRALAEHLKKTKGLRISMREVVEVDKSELKALSEKSRTLGCEPSFNWYEPSATIGVDPKTYTKRSAGGHLHFGLPGNLMGPRARLAPILDVVLGSTSVLIDRDADAAVRRQVYGRAGEFRLPRHGFEYRTLSNFWLRSKELVGLVTGLGKLAIWILDTSVSEEWDAESFLFAHVDPRLAQKAINENSLELAKANFVGLQKFIELHVPAVAGEDSNCGLDAKLLPQFRHFIKRIDEKGLEYWFPEDVLTHWAKVNYDCGWESFLETRVAHDAKHPA